MNRHVHHALRWIAPDVDGVRWRRFTRFRCVRRRRNGTRFGLVGCLGENLDALAARFLKGPLEEVQWLVRIFVGIGAKIKDGEPRRFGRDDKDGVVEVFFVALQ